MERLQNLAGAASWNIGSFISPTAFPDFWDRIKTKMGLLGPTFRVLHSSIEMFSSWAPGLSYCEPLTHWFSRRFTWWASLLNDSGCVVQNWKIIVPRMGKNFNFSFVFCGARIVFFICPCFAGGMGGENEQHSSSFFSLSSLSLFLLSFFIPALHFYFLLSFSLCFPDMLISSHPPGEGALLPRLPRQPFLTGNWASAGASVKVHSGGVKLAWQK